VLTDGFEALTGRAGTTNPDGRGLICIAAEEWKILGVALSTELATRRGPPVEKPNRRGGKRKYGAEIVAASAEFETNLRPERQPEGTARSKAGRRPISIEVAGGAPELADGVTGHSNRYGRSVTRYSCRAVLDVLHLRNSRVAAILDLSFYSSKRSKILFLSFSPCSTCFFE
jgi:hypothetical protein